MPCAVALKFFSSAKVAPCILGFLFQAKDTSFPLGREILMTYPITSTFTSCSTVVLILSSYEDFVLSPPLNPPR